MAGTLVITTLSDGTNSTSATNCIQGSAKAWVNFNGISGSVAIRASYNVSSVTRNATGYYTINFTNALPDANYCVSGTAAIGSGNLLALTPFTATTSATYTAGTTSSFNVASSNLTTAVVDSSAICVSVFD
jgi:hypothetical protein